MAFLPMHRVAVGPEFRGAIIASGRQKEEYSRRLYQVAVAVAVAVEAVVAVSVAVAVAAVRHLVKMEQRGGRGANSRLTFKPFASC